MPFFHTFSADSSHPGTCNPTQLAAKLLDIAARVQQRAKSHVAANGPKSNQNTPVSWEYAAAVMPDPQEKRPAGAFRYYRRRYGVSNPAILATFCRL